MPPRVKKRKRGGMPNTHEAGRALSRRRIRSSVAGSADKAECEICVKLRGLFHNGVDRYGDSITSIKLDSPEQFMLSPSCQHHPRLISFFLDVDFRSTSIGKIDVFKSTMSQGASIHGYSVDGKSRVSAQLHLVTEKSDKTGGGRLVDPEWIDCGLLRHWIDSCDHLHKGQCTSKKFGPAIANIRPTYLVDCRRHCLVPDSAIDSYIALSYVWGKVATLKTTKSNLEQLQQEHSLAPTTISSQIPCTIRDAIALTTILGVRYLWVDSLCIVQDDEVQKHSEIRNMGGVYANALLTVVSTDADANHGLRGLRGCSRSRDFTQKLFRFNKDTEVVDVRYYRQPSATSPWEKRAWTFQERMFSLRCIIFHDETVTWECGVTRWFEDFKETPNCEPTKRNAVSEQQRALSSKYPDIGKLQLMVRQYNTRDSTYPDDIHNAFAGILSCLCQGYKGGFVYGLPVVLFDISLLWLPDRQVYRRGRDESSSCNRIPSWTWMGWKGRIDDRLWILANDWFRNPPSEFSYNLGLHLVSPLVQWYGQTTKNSTKVRIQSEWYNYRKSYLNNTTFPPPNGWKRHDCVPRWYSRSPETKVMPRCFYKHESDMDTEFWYPIPLCNPGDERLVLNSIHMLCCRTRRAWLLGGERLVQDLPIISLRNKDGVWAGVLQLHEDLPAGQAYYATYHNLARVIFELVEISRGYADETRYSPSLREMEHKERPRRGSIYEFYNALWIEWRDGIAYRKGLGRVEKDTWEAENPEYFDLTLG